MSVNINEVTQAIKRVGASGVRVIPMAGQPHDGQQQIEIMEGGSWRAIATGFSTKMAADLVKQSINRTLCG